MPECADCARLRAQLANAAEDRAELLDDYLAAKRDAERDAARATVAEQDLREARRMLEDIKTEVQRLRDDIRAEIRAIEGSTYEPR